MSANTPSESRVFEIARQIPSEKDRRQYVDHICGEDDARRARILQLIENDKPDSFMEGHELTLEETIESTAQVAQEGQMIGRYKLLEQLGEGGFGTVWAAEQKHPVKRRVAVKIIKLGMDTKQVVARFEAERQALALMDHPNIAKVLDAGSTESGRPYFVMELVRGIRFTDYCDHEKLATRTRLELFGKVCHAIQHAHQKGIIHRDIKPSNILVTLHDGVPVPKVIDFGIAKATQQELTEKTIYTQVNQFIGTPAYMSPEQAEMSGLDIDTRSDVYSLGVLLYELLTGKTPFDPKDLLASGLEGLLEMIREKQPQKPSTKLGMLQGDDRTTTAKRRGSDPHQLISALRGDLDWIVMKCLEKDRTRRYDTANGLAADITRHLNDEPIMARPPTTIYQFQKAWRRNKVVYAAAAMVLASLIAGISVSAWQAWVATVAGREAEAARGRESILRKEAEDGERAQRLIAYSADMKLAREHLRNHNRAAVDRILDRYVPEPGSDDLRDIEWHHLRRTGTGDEIYTLPHEAEVRSISLSADGARMASMTMSGKVRLMEVDSRTILQEHGGGNMSFGVRQGLVALSPDGRYLAAALQGILTVWNADNSVVLLEENYVVAPVGFSPDSRYLAAVTDAGIRMWKTDDWNSSHVLETSLEIGTSQLQALAFTPDSRRVIFSPSPFASKVVIHNLVEDSTEGILTGLTNPHVICTDGSIVAAAGRDGQVGIWDLASRDIAHTFKAHTRLVVAVALSPDGKTLATGGNDSEIKLWDTQTFEMIGALSGHHSQVWGLDFSENGRYLASASMDQSVKLWDWNRQKRIARGTPSVTNRDSGVASEDGGNHSRAQSNERVQGNASRIHNVMLGDSIQEAVDAATPGDRINLAAGVHEISETIHLDKPLIIGGAARNEDELAPLPTVLKGAEGLTYVMQLQTGVGSGTALLDLRVETSSSGIQHLSGDITMRRCQIIVKSVLNFQKVISLEATGSDDRPTDTATIDGCILSAEYVGDAAEHTPPDVDVVLTAPNTRYKEITVTHCQVTNEVPNRISNGIETRGTTAHLTISDNRVRCRGMGIVFPNHRGAMDIRNNKVWAANVGIIVGTESPKRSTIIGNHVHIDEQLFQVYPLFIRDYIADNRSVCIAVGATSAAVAEAFFKTKVIGRGMNIVVEQNTLKGNPTYGIAMMDSPTPENYGPPTPNDSHDNVISQNDFTGLDAEWNIALGASTYDNLIVDNIGVGRILREAGNNDRNTIDAD